jgi:hypothetical protein
MKKGDLKAGLTLAHIFVILLISVVPLGDALRGRELPSIFEFAAASDGIKGAILRIGFYLFLCQGAFFLPYYFLCAVLAVRYDHDWKTQNSFDRGFAKVNVGFIAFACYIMFVTYLRPLVVFVRWSNMLISPFSLVALFFLFVGCLNLKKQLGKLNIKFRHDSEIFLQCPKCRHESTIAPSKLGEITRSQLEASRGPWRM